MAFFASIVNSVVHKLNVDSKVLFNEDNKKTLLPVIAPLMADPQYAECPAWKMGAVGLTTMLWLSTMDSALRHRKCFHAFIRYEDLIETRVPILVALLNACGFESSVDDVQAIETIFASDAHGEDAATAGNRFRKNKSFFQGDDKEGVVQIIACHKVIQHADFQFDETLRV
jgi:hypothetical protein